MSTARSSSPLAARAVCAAAGLRDALRTAQFFMRVLSGAEDWGRSRPEMPAGDAPRPPTLSKLVARLARFADCVMTAAVNLWLKLTLPEWRKLPSPFTHGMMADVMGAIRAESFVANPLFNTYFYRAAIHILKRFRKPPFLVLEHRVDAARRLLVEEMGPAGESDTGFLARALTALVGAAAIARPGTALGAAAPMSAAQANLMVYATACVALLFAEEGKPVQELDEDQFFAIVSALIAPRLPRIGRLIEASDTAGLTAELVEIKEMY
jgi:hypothetical protein